MEQYACVTDGVVVNIVVAEQESDIEPLRAEYDSLVLVESDAQGDARIGAEHVDGTFALPEDNPDEVRVSRRADRINELTNLGDEASDEQRAELDRLIDEARAEAPQMSVAPLR